MSAWPDQKIHAIAMRLIRESSRDPQRWACTKLDELDARIECTMAEGELPLVSIYVSPTSWSVHTTRRIICRLGSEQLDVSPLDVLNESWGSDPKGAEEHYHGLATYQLRDGRSMRFEFERGLACMGPMQVMKFWRLKYPVLDNLVI